MYLELKLLHIGAVILFLGNIITGLFWKSHADRTGDPKAIAHAFEGIIRSDRLFTIPGVLLIVLTGFSTALVGRIPILSTGWLFWSIVLFTVSGVIFMARVAPLQKQIVALARTGSEQEQFDWLRYRALSRTWEFWGLAALLTPCLAVILMVLKPDLPALPMK